MLLTLHITFFNCIFALHIDAISTYYQNIEKEHLDSTKNIFKHIQYPCTQIR